MEFSCHTWAFHDLPLTEALGTIARLGFRYADIGTGPGFNLRGAVGAPARTATEIQHDLLLFDLKISDLYLMLPRISLGATEPDAERRGKDLELFKALMPFAKALNPPGITVSPGVIQPDEAAFDRTVDALKQMLDAVQAINVPLSIEPHLESMGSTPEAALKLVEAVPGLKITLDWAQMVTQNIAHEAVLPLLEHTRHVQIRQAAPHQLQTPFDSGKLELPRILRDLFTRNYQGVVCVELMNIPAKPDTVKPAAGKKNAAKQAAAKPPVTVDMVREVITVRDALREARNIIEAEAKKASAAANPPPPIKRDIQREAQDRRNPRGKRT